MGDKTQLLAIILATRFRQPLPIIAGIFCATVLNHGIASWFGVWIGDYFSADILKWILAATFLGFAAWILIPDKSEDTDHPPRFGAFLTTLVTFFLAEIGDKTQLATVALGAKYAAPAIVTFGTTLGMLAADGLAVFFGESLTRKISMVWIRRLASILFAAFGIAILL